MRVLRGIQKTKNSESLPQELVEALEIKSDQLFYKAQMKNDDSSTNCFTNNKVCNKL